MQFAPSDQATGFRWECAATGRTADEQGVFITGRQLSREAYSTADPEVFLCAAAIKEMARKLGWHSPEDIDEIVARFNAQTLELDALKERLEKLEQFKALEEELTHA